MIRAMGRRLLLGAIVVFVICVAWPRPQVSGEVVIPADPAPIGQKAMQYFGVASCASMACHHANGLKGTPRSEYSTWVGHDKHAQAFLVLYNERSQRIAKNLTKLLTVDGKPTDKATEAALCLKCHSTSNGERVGAGPRFSVSEGVSCEACHGPSGNWLTTHYKHGFKELSVAQKAAYGLWPTKDLSFRARLCTTCHIGDGSKEVNHDLIAAGHPRLSFELGAYQGTYHRHWLLSDEKARYPDFQARTWLIGQVVSARAAIDLLKSRAERAVKEDPHTPWPEFAEYECFACHQDLKVKGKDQIKARYGNRRPGSYPWQTWYLSMFENLAALDGMELKELEKLRELMQSASPLESKIAEQSKAVLEEMDAILKKIEGMKTLDAAQMRGYFKGFLGQAEKRSGSMEWDDASQLYLSMAAMHHGLSNYGDQQIVNPRMRKALKSYQSKLQSAFPEGYDSPGLYNPQEKPSLDSLFEEIRKAFGN